MNRSEGGFTISPDRVYKLNYKFQPIDNRDYVYSIKPTNAIISRTSFSLRNKITIILNQGNIGSCVSNAFAQYILISTSSNIFISRLFHYYCARLLSSPPGLSNLEDTGLYIRDACKTISKVGACKESLWGYNTSKFSIMPPISTFQYPQCRFFKKYTYTFIDMTTPTALLTNIKGYLTTKKLPVLFGFTVYSSFFTVGGTGMVPMPNTSGSENIEGGHCMLIIGFNDTTRRFICVNSWGSSWGDGGYCYIPYDYLLNASLASDFCGITFVY